MRRVLIVFLILLMIVGSAEAVHIELDIVDIDRDGKKEAVARLYWEKEEGWHLIWNAETYARQIYNMFINNSVEIERSVESIAGEIRAHVLGYWFGVSPWSQVNPMDIESWRAPWWFILLD